MQAAPGPGRRSGKDESPSSQGFRRLRELPPGRERERLRSELVCAWLPMAHRIASRFRDRGEAMDDLRQVAAMGLVKAVDRYDPQRSDAFETYAVPTVTGELKRHFRDCTWDVHVPRRIQDLRNRVRTTRRDLIQAEGGPQSPTHAQIVAAAGLSEDDVRLGMEALGSYSALSLDAEPAGVEGGTPLVERLGACDGALDVAVDREAVKPGLRKLAERERLILYLRFFGDMSQRSIAERLGLSQMHVSRLLHQSCERLRHDALHEAA
ncbi:SigB/SigF/SigG family RNA polymerase sigma factor [Streptomyces sp. CAI-121]|uniref:SigB/SigF/SigG family RNA polymerase sigma factor n=1 Tax=unclassified Streptomyces TaxID=2593676 RepID=UPI00158708CF|nr:MULTISPECIES: SigB/SigF/SigG family RNA polymerase sigma factor [unclassified Streptomyces]NUV72396.1 SigB/SigF/SigG family RNA polymerase sigma factor [Streptomyces sp. CAI-121]NUW18389.1 SigB/SigF/SigG family RNA polymerase sigma factor [Streptomyces sp. CAI-68]